MQRILLLLAFAASASLAAETHRISAKGGISYSVVNPADLAEDRHVYPLDAAISGLLYIPDSAETYNCAASYKAQLLPTAGGEESGGKPGCQSTPTTVEVEYRLMNRFRLLYSRLYMPRASYASEFVSPTIASGVVGFSRTINAYYMRHGRSTAGAGYLHPITDSFRIGPTVRGVKEFSLYTVTPTTLTLLRAGSTSAGGFVFQNGKRERILSGTAPGADLEFEIIKNMNLLLSYSRFKLTGGMSEARVAGSATFAGSAFALSAPSVDATEAKMSHSGYDAGIGFRFGSGSPGAFHFGLLKRKFIRQYDSYYRVNSAYAGNLVSQTINLVYVNALYTTHRYIQTEKYVEMKMELGLGF